MMQFSLDLSGEHRSNSLYYDHAGFKDYGTSLEAAISVTPTIKEAQRKLLELLKDYPQGLTADQASHILGWSSFYGRPRVSELHKTFRIKAVGRAINPNTGKAMNKWGLA